MASGRAGTCKLCAASKKREQRSKQRAKIILEPSTSQDFSSESIFADRESLTAGLRVEFEKALSHAKETVEFNRKRLAAAEESGDPKSIEEATKAFQRSQSAHVHLITRLSEKLQGLDELAAKAEKARPVTFFLLQPGKFPDLAAMRQIPEEYWPDESAKLNEVEFD